jgi:hypothetical protein
MHQGHFGGIGTKAEHTFAKKCRAQGNAIQSADQLVANPSFDAMGKSSMMQNSK